MSTNGKEVEQEVTGEQPDYDLALLEQVKVLMAERRWTIDNLADQIGTHTRATVSRYLSQKLENPENVEQAMATLLVKESRIASGAEFAWTSPAQAIAIACDYAVSCREIVPIQKRAGTGKTTAVKAYLAKKQRENPGKYAFVEITAHAHLTAGALLREILIRLRAPIRGDANAMLNRILVELKRRQYTLVIDDANHLNYRALEDLRRMHDESACGLILISTRRLMDRMLQEGGRNGEDLEQFHSRIGFRHVEIPDISRRDQERVARAKVSDLTEKSLDMLCKPGRVPRVIHKILDRATFLKRHVPVGTRFDTLIEQAEREIHETA